MRFTVSALSAAFAFISSFNAFSAAPASLPQPLPSAPAVAAPLSSVPDFVGESASADARYAAGWVMANRDNEQLPFAIVDKKAAKLFVFAPSGRMVGATSALLGLTPGDETVPGVGRRVQSGRLTRAERTTPAGRFISEPGHNLGGEDIVWVDYEAAFAIHRLRKANPAERRGERLASKNIDDKRISLGCVVVPVAFYEGVVSPVLGRSRAVVYVLPETRPVQSMFDAYQVGLASR